MRNGYVQIGGDGNTFNPFWCCCACIALISISVVVGVLVGVGDDILPQRQFLIEGLPSPETEFAEGSSIAPFATMQIGSAHLPSTLIIESRIFCAIKILIVANVSFIACTLNNIASAPDITFNSSTTLGRYERDYQPQGNFNLNDMTLPLHTGILACSGGNASTALTLTCHAETIFCPPDGPPGPLTTCYSEGIRLQTEATTSLIYLPLSASPKEAMPDQSAQHNLR